MQNSILCFDIWGSDDGKQTPNDEILHENGSKSEQKLQEVDKTGERNSIEQGKRQMKPNKKMKQKKRQDDLVKEQNELVIFQRYCHMYKCGELLAEVAILVDDQESAMVNPNLSAPFRFEYVSHGYDHGNWYVQVRKLS